MNFSLINKFWFWVFVSCLTVVAISIANAETKLIFGQSYFWEDILFWAFLGTLFVISVALGFKGAVGISCVAMCFVSSLAVYFTFFIGQDVLIFVQTFFVVSFIPGIVAFSLGYLLKTNK